MSSLLHQGRASYAFFERNWNLSKRYWAWEVVWLVYNIVNAMSVTYIGKAAQTLTHTKVDTNYLVLYLLIGTAVWSYLSVTFEGVTDMITIERWEGTIENTSRSSALVSEQQSCHCSSQSVVRRCRTSYVPSSC